MPAIPRQKACIACADSKRRCDKQLPECQRCLDRDVDCVYPQPKRRRRDPPADTSQVEGLPAVQGPIPADPDVPGPGLDFGDWGAIGAGDLDMSLSDLIMPYIPSPPALIPNQPAQRIALESDGVPSSTPNAWFLGDETWTLQHSQKQPRTPTNLDLEPFIQAVEEMLQFWVRNGYNSFIHRRLYDKDMPACVQDAFTTFATYVGRTPAVKDTILQIAEQRSSALVNQVPCIAAGGAQGLRAHLARVHALFVYQFILLFDGSVRSRAHAEKHQPTLRQWVAQMCSAAKQYRGEDIFPRDPHSYSWALSKFDREYETASGMWKLWVLIESVRRSQLIIDTISNVYDTLTKGWAECTGAVMFTARRGLWEADSPMKWFELSSAKEPLLVPSLLPGPLISQYDADEFDDLVRVVWSCVIGTDKMKGWIDKSNEAIRV
ncbi:hypothetical protein Daesc_009469 [Daldinia eschscholtzii]|uniref:Zn(2)-C6 fungal-type domain-containing protein n=1 Tax=Daldinia eschscholtzii TaxID=292717 RepID=A0AAX6MAA4_9PEZI